MRTGRVSTVLEGHKVPMSSFKDNSAAHSHPLEEPRIKAFL